MDYNLAKALCTINVKPIPKIPKIIIENKVTVPTTVEKATVNQKDVSTAEKEKTQIGEHFWFSACVLMIRTYDPQFFSSCFYCPPLLM